MLDMTVEQATVYLKYKYKKSFFLERSSAVYFPSRWRAEEEESAMGGGGWSEGQLRAVMQFVEGGWGIFL